MLLAGGCLTSNPGRDFGSLLRFYGDVLLENRHDRTEV